MTRLKDLSQEDTFWSPYPASPPSPAATWKMKLAQLRAMGSSTLLVITQLQNSKKDGANTEQHLQRHHVEAQSGVWVTWTKQDSFSEALPLQKSVP